MFLQTLHLHQFRNYEDQLVQFSAPKTIVVGENAQGKSNLLEAVELLSTLHSHRVSHDRDLVKLGQTSGRVQAQLERSGSVFHLGITFRVAGCETHVCVRQTVYDLRLKEVQPVLVADAVGSRREADRQLALQEMRHDGIVIASTEAVLFELLETAEHPKFKEIQALIK